MQITDQVEAILSQLDDDFQNDGLSAALVEAERLADQFSSIKPQPYIVPIERFAGLPILGESKIPR